MCGQWANFKKYNTNGHLKAPLLDPILSVAISPKKTYILK